MNKQKVQKSKHFVFSNSDENRWKTMRMKKKWPTYFPFFSKNQTQMMKRAPAKISWKGFAKKVSSGLRFFKIILQNGKWAFGHSFSFSPLNPHENYLEHTREYFRGCVTQPFPFGSAIYSFDLAWKAKGKRFLFHFQVKCCDARLWRNHVILPKFTHLVAEKSPMTLAKCDME